MEDNQNKDEIENVETLFEDEEVITPETQPTAEPTTMPAPVTEPVTEPLTEAPVFPVEPVTEAVPEEPLTEAPVVPTEPAPEVINEEPLTEAPVVPTEPATEAVTEAPTTAPVEPVPEPAAEEEPKKGNTKLIAIIVLILLIAAGAYVYFCTDIINKDNKKSGGEAEQKEPQTQTGYADKFVGIYKSENDKLYIKKVSDTKIHYSISGSFAGEAKVDGNVAKGESSDKNRYFEFKLSDNNIEVIYHAEDGVYVVVDTGLYTKVCDYTKENVYKEAVGDPSYLNGKYSGVYNCGDITLNLYQINENEVIVALSEKTKLLHFDEKFVIAGDNLLYGYTIFQEPEPVYTITFTDKSFTLTANEEAFGFDEENKALELTYTFVKEITQDDILNEYYNLY